MRKSLFLILRVEKRRLWLSNGACRSIKFPTGDTKRYSKHYGYLPSVCMPSIQNSSDAAGMNDLKIVLRKRVVNVRLCRSLYWRFCAETSCLNASRGLP